MYCSRCISLKIRFLFSTMWEGIVSVLPCLFLYLKILVFVGEWGMVRRWDGIYLERDREEVRRVFCLPTYYIRWIRGLGLRKVRMSRY